MCVKRNAYHRPNGAVETPEGFSVFRAFPTLDLIDYEKDNSALFGFYYDKLTFEMEDNLSESTYHYLDSIISAGNTEWSKHNNEYNYSITWRKREAIPLEDIKEPYGDISLSFKKGSKILVLSTKYMWIFDD